MKRQLNYLFLTGFLLLFFAPQTNAHVLQSDDQVGAILHIIPNDNPVTGEKVEYLLSFQDITKRFSLKNCDCFVSYSANGKHVAKMPLNSNYETDSLNSFAFPEAAVYNLEVSGKPKGDKAFQPFRFNFTVRVSSREINTQGIPKILWLGLAGVVSLIILAAYWAEISYKTPLKK